MRQAIDDLPSVSVSRLRASGAISPADETATLAADGSSFVVGLSHLRFPNGGGWSFFVCSCGRRTRTLRLHQHALLCRRGLEARGLRWRVQSLSPSDRASYVAANLEARLSSSSPARLNPRKGRTLDRRARFEAALVRAQFVVARRLLRGCGGR
jgi:hypothetical protein